MVSFSPGAKSLNYYGLKTGQRTNSKLACPVDNDLHLQQFANGKRLTCGSSTNKHEFSSFKIAPMAARLSVRAASV